MTIFWPTSGGSEESRDDSLLGRQNDCRPNGVKIISCLDGGWWMGPKESHPPSKVFPSLPHTGRETITSVHVFRHTALS